MMYYLLYFLLLLPQQQKNVYLYFKVDSPYCSKIESPRSNEPILNMITYKFGLNRKDTLENDYYSDFKFIQLVINPNNKNDRTFSKFNGNIVRKHINFLRTIDYKEPDWFISDYWDIVYGELNRFDNYFVIENHPTCKDSIVVRKVDYHKIEFE